MMQENRFYHCQSSKKKNIKPVQKGITNVTSCRSSMLSGMKNILGQLIKCLILLKYCSFLLLCKLLLSTFRSVSKIFHSPLSEPIMIKIFNRILLIHLFQFDLKQCTTTLKRRKIKLKKGEVKLNSVGINLKKVNSIFKKKKSNQNCHPNSPNDIYNNHKYHAHK